MRVISLKRNPKVYSCNCYYIRGDWNRIEDINTLIDTGSDDFILEELESISGGVGKKRVDQVIITHEHFDHSGGLKAIIEKYNPTVISYNRLPGVTVLARDSKKIKLADDRALILHTPFHSFDSICVYCEESQALFSGDTPLIIRSPGGTYTKEYLDIMKRLSRLNIKTIYTGHDDPITNNISDLLEQTIFNILKSKIVE